MSTATVHLTNRSAIELDALLGAAEGATSGVLMTLLAGGAPLQPYNCVVIPIDRVRALIAGLELVARQAAPA